MNLTVLGIEQDPSANDYVLIQTDDGQRVAKIVNLGSAIGVSGSSGTSFTATIGDTFALATAIAVSWDESGYIIAADKGDSTKVELAGFVDGDSYINGDTTTVYSGGMKSGFSGLTVGQPVFVGDSGDVTQDIQDIDSGEYRVYVGIATAADTVFLNIQEAVYNADNLYEGVTATSGDTFPTEAVLGQEVYRTDLSKWYKYTGSAWMQI
jgi:hypothetical protein